MSVWEEVEAEYACMHPEREVRYSIVSNGVRQYRTQCITCGELSQFLRHADPLVMAVADPVPVDEALREAHYQTIRMEAQRRITERADLDMQERGRQRDEADTQWWAEYNTYLQSGDWQARRTLVLERDDYLCQACRRARATQAHHLTYAHLGAEPLFDLVSVCSSCHDRITAMDRVAREQRRKEHAA